MGHDERRHGVNTARAFAPRFASGRLQCLRWRWREGTAADLVSYGCLIPRVMNVDNLLERLSSLSTMQ